MLYIFFDYLGMRKKREKKEVERKKNLRLEKIMLMYLNKRVDSPKKNWEVCTLRVKINTPSRCLCESNEIRVSNLLISIRTRHIFYFIYF